MMLRLKRPRPSSAKDEEMFSFLVTSSNAKIDQIIQFPGQTGMTGLSTPTRPAGSAGLDLKPDRLFVMFILRIDDDRLVSRDLVARQSQAQERETRLRKWIKIAQAGASMLVSIARSCWEKA